MQWVKYNMKNDIGHIDSIAHSFIIKIWQEDSDEESRQVSWIGNITHVISGKRIYFQSLDDINSFIVPYLRQMGAET